MLIEAINAFDKLLQFNVNSHILNNQKKLLQ